MKKLTIFKFQSVTCKLLSAIFLSVCIIFSICVYHSFAEVPCMINYQGRLIENNVPVSGPKTMVFSIYDSLGTELWTSGEKPIQVHNGLFRHVLGEGFIGGSPVADLSSIDWTAGEELYLEVTVGVETLSPREPIYAYPYAINSHLLEGKTTAHFLDVSGSTQTKKGGLNIEGNVGIGTTEPDESLDVAGNIRTTGGINYGGLQDYRMVYRDDFESDATGWSYTTRSTIAGATILGGYNLTSNTSFYRDYDLTGIAHSEVMVRLTYYAMDTWDNEFGWIRVDDDRCIWSKRIAHGDGGRINFGGWSSYKDGIYYAEGRASHTGNTLRVTVGSNLDSGPSDESFGVDNVEVWVR